MAEQRPQADGLGAGRPGRGGLVPLGATGILLALLAVWLLLPIFLAIGRGFIHEGRLSLYWFGRVIGNEILRRQFLNSLLLACATTALALLLALPLALVRARYRFLGQGLLGVLVLVPMILPPFVGALAMRRLFSQFGAVNLALEQIGLLDFSRSLPPDWLGSGLAGVVLLQSLHLFPILYLNAAAAIANTDPAYAQAARNLGAGPIRTFWKVSLPLMRPGLFAGGTIVFIWSLTDIGTPLIIGYEHLVPVTIFKELARSEFTGRTYSLVFLMLSGAVTLYVLGKFVFGARFGAESSKATVAAETPRLGLIGTLLAWALFGAVIFLAILPHIGVILTATSGRWINTVLPSRYTLRHLRFVVTQQDTYQSIFNSLKYAGVSTFIDLLLGGATAWLIVRARVRGRTLLDGLSMMPLAVPGLILAAGYVAMTATGPLKAIGPTEYPVIILIIAYAVRRLPFVVRGISAGLEQVPESLEEAARNLGAGGFAAATRITLPLIMANIVAAAVLVFAFAVLEVSDSLILAQTSDYYPITKQIYSLATSTGSPESANQAAALGVYGMAFLAATMTVATALLGRRLGTIFRA